MIKFDISENVSDSICAKVEDFALRIKYLGFKPKNNLQDITKKFLEVFGMHKLALFYRKAKKQTLKKV